jgi:hypothetical protein
MRFMMLVKANKYSEEGVPPDPRLMQAVGKLAEQEMRNGRLLMTGGLGPSSQGARIYAANDTLTVKDGPFVETKELVGGFAIMQFESREEAVEQGKRFMRLHLDTLGPGYEGQLEIRQIVGAEDMA